MKKNWMLILSIAMLHNLPAQWKGAIEQYSYFSSGSAFTVTPVVHIQSAGRWYGQLRYNYEEAGAFSFSAGRAFLIPGSFQTAIIPMLGVVAGSMHGYNLVLNHETEWKDFYFSSESQYTLSSKTRHENFFYSWLEGGYNLSEKIFAGISVQFTHLYQQQPLVEKGLVFGWSVQRWTFPVYFFEPFSHRGYLIIGINYQWQIKQGRGGLSGSRDVQPLP